MEPSIYGLVSHKAFRQTFIDTTALVFLRICVMDAQFWSQADLWRYKLNLTVIFHFFSFYIYSRSLLSVFFFFSISVYPSQ